LRTAFRFVLLGLVSAIVSFPLAFISTILMNPLLGRLEVRYGVELTGHSGPADWIFAVVFAAISIALFVVLALATRRPSSAASGDREADSPSNAM
jgi:hypothetical protein